MLTDTHMHADTHTPSIHLLLSSEITKGVRRCRPFRFRFYVAGGLN